MKTQCLEFQVNAGFDTPDGKPTYPAQMTVVLSRYEALRAIAVLVEQLKDEQRDVVELPLCGGYELGEVLDSEDPNYG